MAEQNKIEIDIIANDQATRIIEAFKQSIASMSLAMQRNMATAFNQVDAEVKKLNKTTKDHTEQVKRAKTEQDHYKFALSDVRREIANLRNMYLLFMFVFRPFINFIKESISSYMEQEDVINRLNYALRLQGTYSKNVSQNLIELANAFQATTRFGDEAIMRVMQKLITIGNILPSQLKEVTQATLDFATLTGRDLDTAANVMAKAAAGFTRELSQYGIAIDRNIPKAQKFAEVQKFLAKRMGGAAQKDVETFAGKIDILKNKYNDLQEVLGSSITTNTTLGKIFNFVSNQIDKYTESIKRAQGQTLEYKLKDIDEEILSMESYVKSSTNAINLLFQPKGVEESIKKLEELRDERLRVIRGMQQEQEAQKMNEVWLGRIDIVNESFAKRKKIQEEFYDEYEKLNENKLMEEFRILEENVAKYREHVDNKIEVDEYYRIKRKEILEDIQAEQIRQGNILVRLHKETADAATKAFEDGFFNIMTGQFRKLEDVVISFGETMLRVLSRIAAEKLVESIFGIFTVGTPAPTPVKTHSGGYIKSGQRTSNFGYGIPRFHTGGEVPAYLLPGEGVINKMGMNRLGIDNLNRLNRGESFNEPTVINNYYIQTIDERSFRDRLSQNGDIYSASVEGNIKDNYSIRKTMQRFG